MNKVFIMYNLKPGVSINEFRKFVTEIDYKITPNQPGIQSFKTYEIKGTYEIRDVKTYKDAFEKKGGEIFHKGDVPYQFVECIDVERWESWDKVAYSDAMNPVADAWYKFVDKVSVHIYGEEIK